MYTLRKNGNRLSEHQTYAEACRQARMLSATDRKAYFTVHDSSQGSNTSLKYRTTGSMCVPDYIVQPQANSP